MKIAKPPAILPIIDTQSILPVNDQPAPGETSSVPKGESEQKRDEEENTISGTQEDPVSQDFHEAKSE